MFFYLSKILLFLIKPLVWVVFLLIAGLLSNDDRKKKRRLIAGTVLLYLMSNSFLVNELFIKYEDEGTLKPDSVYEVGIVLGGFSKEDTGLNRTVFYEATDRLMQAVRAYHNGLIKKILISGGSSGILKHELKEADAVHRFLIETGIPDSAILLENRSRNTLENIEFSGKLLDTAGIRGKPLIFTSAWHVPRVKLCLNGVMDADFYSCNFLSDKKRDYNPDNLLVPSPKALQNLELLIKEWFGYLFYMIKVS